MEQIIDSLKNQQIKIAVIGSRSFDDYELLARSIKETMGRYEVATVVSGGAKGADSLAERYAAENNLQTMILKPDWKKFGRGAGVIRNKDIVENADYVLAFWDGSSKGTQNSIDHARKMNKPVKVIKY